MAATAIDLQPYASLNDEDCDRRIVRAKQALGERVVILGHHYQRDEIFKHADFSGDSLKLSRQAADSKAEFIVFCGVQFMSPMVCMCSTMFRIDPPHLAWVLENLVEGNIVNQISVPEDVANNARIALQRMLDI
jgi:quinolinate synthase